MSKLLSAAEILAADDLKSVDESVPEWGGIVRLRALSAGEVLSMTRELETKKDEGMFEILVRCAVDDNGAPVFTPDQIPELKKKSMQVLDRLQKVALRLNSMRPQDGVELKKD